MELKKQALILWLQAATEAEVTDINELRDGVLLEQLLLKIDGFVPETEGNKLTDWKVAYSKLKSLYEQINTAILKNTKMSVPHELSYMNLIEMAQGKSQQGLQTLLHLAFIICIQSSLKADFIPCIMKLPSEAQKELMLIIQESSARGEEEDEKENVISEYKETITKLQYAYNTLVNENEGLRTSLIEEDERVNKNEESMKNMHKQNERLNREVFDKNEQLIKLREAMVLGSYGSVNEQLLEDLKKELLEREQNYGQQILDLNETISNLKDEISHMRKNNNDLLEQQSTRSMTQGKMDHSSCISIEKHKVRVNQMLAMSKDATQKEMTAKLQNIKLKNRNTQLQSKIKKLTEDIHQKDNDFSVTKEDASKLKIEFFTRIRDSLKQKLQEFKPSTEGNSAEFLQNEA